MRKYYLLLVVVLLLALTGCNEKESTEKITLNASDIFEIVEEKVEENTVTISAREGAIGSRISLEKRDASELARYDASNRRFIGNTTINNSQKSLFCIDPDTGAVYFVNQNKDWYIYCLYNGRAEVAVKLPARELYMWNGTLYFVIEDYDTYELDGVKDNDIYAYTPEDGSVTFLYAAKEFEEALESHLGVDENGLYLYCEKIKETYITEDGNNRIISEVYSYHLPFGSSELVEAPEARVFPRLEDYNPGFEAIIQYGNGEATRMDISNAQFCMIGDIFYFTNGESLKFYIAETVSGEVKCFDCATALEEVSLFEPERDKITSFAVTKDCIWVLVGDEYLIKIDPESGDMSCYVTMYWTDYLYAPLEELYTDGVKLYGLYKYSFHNSPAVLVEITGREQEISFHYKLPALAVEELTD